MKWFNRIAQGFSPGKELPSDRPVRAADMGGVLAQACKFSAAAKRIGVRSGVGNYESGTWK
jgi:hypothetical protein